MLWYLRSKIHKTVVIGGNFAYVGSITVDEDLLDTCGLDIGEKLLVVSNTSRARLETYCVVID